MMNTTKVYLVGLLLAGLPLMASAQSKTETIKVAGNCSMCQKHIETAAKKAGATEAKWNKKTKELTVSFDQSKTSDDAIQKAVAASGYDTEKYAGDEKAYNGLDECCQYEGKKKSGQAK
jgi:copper chaperone CopZ